MPAPMRRLALVIAVLFALGLAGGAPAQARPVSATLARADLSIDWSNLTEYEHALVLRRLKRAPSVVGELLYRVAGRLTIHRSMPEAPAGGNFTETQYDGTHVAWQVNLSQYTLNWSSKLGAHLTMHELGHVIDGALIDDDLRNAFLALFRPSPYWNDCYPMPQGASSRCVRAPEIFADQFAFWATGFGDVRTFYNLPPFASLRDFGALLACTSVRVLSEPSRAARAPLGSATSTPPTRCGSPVERARSRRGGS